MVTPSPETVLFAKGTVIQGRYRLEGRLGTGGVATVYQAQYLKDGRRVALKMLRHAVQFDTGRQRNVVVERFDREARMCSRLRHPNLVRMLDYGVWLEQGLPFIVMELLEGHDLKTEIERKRRLSLPRTLDLLLPCLDGLTELHDRGLVHRDIKPSNLFLARNGGRERLVAIDLGIAYSVVSSDPRLTLQGQILGTPQYLAPELVEADRFSPAMDVYQMGLVLVECLTGEAVVPAYEKPWQCIKAHVNHRLRIPGRLMRGLLGDVIQRALHREPEGRYADAAGMARALRVLRQGLLGARHGETGKAGVIGGGGGADTLNNFRAVAQTRDAAQTGSLNPDRASQTLRKISGKVGLALCKQLYERGQPVRAYVQGLEEIERSTHQEAQDIRAFIKAVRMSLRERAKSLLGDLDTKVKRQVTAAEIRNLKDIDQVGGFLISMSDGRMTLGYLLQIAPVDPKDVALELLLLLERGILVRC